MVSVKVNPVRGLMLAVMMAGIAIWSVPAAADSAATYKAKCAMCHGADGKGDNNGERCEQNERCWSHVYFFAFTSHGFPVASVGSDNLIRDERR